MTFNTHSLSFFNAIKCQMSKEFKYRKIVATEVNFDTRNNFTLLPFFIEMLQYDWL